MARQNDRPNSAAGKVLYLVSVVYKEQRYNRLTGQELFEHLMQVVRLEDRLALERARILQYCEHCGHQQVKLGMDKLRRILGKARGINGGRAFLFVPDHTRKPEHGKWIWVDGMLYLASAYPVMRDTVIADLLGAANVIRKYGVGMDETVASIYLKTQQLRDGYQFEEPGLWGAS